ncbi:hypothetical protein GCM10007049_29110 [Echinicola pacifica]|uniref:Por secretion system C-terminal sorting domain-containing protein n=1 Tax=Echinicola pacifica TaxID=346377 RepID=A0A918Q7Z5_9BACT|nr:hypothetical protein [Echinicola pacifica]GGZ33974.1 hypothetical protein GCM10007049_29110 [Echinicola pacifica]
MKSLFTTLLVFAAIFFANATDAPDTLATKASLLSSTQVEVLDDHMNINFAAAVGKVTVCIYDADKKLLGRNQYMANQPLKIPYSFKQMPSGAYFVKVKNKDEEVMYEVKTVEKTIILNMPIVAYGKELNRHTINLKVLGIEEAGTKVDILNEANEVIATDFVMQKEGFERNYKLPYRNVEGLYLRIKDTKGRQKYIYF